jgi:hypothetical protein
VLGRRVETDSGGVDDVLGKAYSFGGQQSAPKPVMMQSGHRLARFCRPWLLPIDKGISFTGTLIHWSVCARVCSVVLDCSDRAVSIDGLPGNQGRLFEQCYRS